MPSNYVGERANTQAPSAKPEPEADITLALPVDGEDLDVASVYQSLKALADFIDQIMHPHAKAALTPRFLHRFRTALGHTRFALDRLGLPTMTYLMWQEFFGGPATSFSGTTAMTAFAANVGGWFGTVLGAGGAVFQSPSDTFPFVTLDGGDALNDYAELWSPTIPDFGADMDMVAEAIVSLQDDDPADVGAMFGMARRSTGLAFTNQQISFTKSIGTANWLAVAIGPSGTTVEDTGVPPSPAIADQRLRIEFRGANTNDGGTPTAYFFIDGTHVKTITTNLPATVALAKSLVFSVKNGSGSSSASEKMFVRAVQFACNALPNVT